MTIDKKVNGNELVLAVSGRLDTTTAPQLEAEVKDLGTVESVVFDFANLEYISSAGLRVVLMTHKLLSKKGGLVVKNLNTTVKEVFDITGFSDIITIG